MKSLIVPISLFFLLAPATVSAGAADCQQLRVALAASLNSTFHLAADEAYAIAMLNAVRDDDRGTRNISLVAASIGGTFGDKVKAALEQYIRLSVVADGVCP
jgi:hypothetical protein